MIAVTGASGNLGGLVFEGLLKVVPPEQLVAVVRSPAKAQHLAASGVHVRRADYSEPETLAPALAGVSRLLLVSGSELGKRVDQHRTVIEAAKASDVALIAYTSVLSADSSTLPIAAEHKATEELLSAPAFLTSCFATAGLSRTTQRDWRPHSPLGLFLVRPATAGSQQPAARTMPLRPSPSSRRMDTAARCTSSPVTMPSP